MADPARSNAQAHELHPLVAEAQLFAETVLHARAGEFDAAGAVPREVIDELAAMGVLGAAVPREHGGSELDPLSYGYLTHAIGKGCSSTRTLLTVHASLVGETLAKLGSRAQRERWLPAMASGERLACFALSEPEVGTDAASVRTTYREHGDGFVIDGQKKWISYAALADLFLVIAGCEGQLSAFMVERESEGLSVEPMSGLLGGRGSHIGAVHFDGVRVPRENLVGRLGTGFSFVTNTALFYGRYSIAWAGAALAEAALEEMVSYARQREQFGRRIGQHQLVQQMVADGVTRVHVGKALCEKVGRLRCANDDQAVMETNIAKYYTSRAAMQVASDAVQVLGGNGCWDRYPTERLFREAKILEIIEGTSQAQQLIIGGYGLRRYHRRAPTPSPAPGHPRVPAPRSSRAALSGADAKHTASA